jgi:hypothetical protein
MAGASNKAIRRTGPGVAQSDGAVAEGPAKAVAGVSITIEFHTGRNRNYFCIEPLPLTCNGPRGST